MNRRRILLLEPNYRNKYPPMGLMKLAMYHRLQGDDVVFYKGKLSDFVLSELTRDAVAKLQEIEKECFFAKKVAWCGLIPDLKIFIQKGRVVPYSEFERALQKQPLAKSWLDSFRRQFRNGGYYDNPRWDRVCVTTLFTFHWNVTIETIEFAKKVCKAPKQVLVGGILASVVPDKLEAKTGIKPHIGSLNVCKLPGDKPLPKPFGRTLIDDLPLDYSILEEIDYQYPATNAYHAYATRGCVNKCAFCAVPILEPGPMKHFISLRPKIKATQQRFGEQRHMLLLDNNVFASDKFDKIIDEICDLGFAKGATFVSPNQLDIAVRQLRDGWNERAYVRLTVRLLNAFVEKLDGERHDRFYGLLLNHGLLHDYTATKDGILTVFAEMKDDYEKARSKKPVIRFIDFNQGMDARLATPEKMAKLATVAIRPFRVAFDTWAIRKHYVNTVRLANENGITQMSNYLLYNFYDKPLDLYRRLLLNIDLCDALGVNIYSFPMKYHPIMDAKWFSNRDYLGLHWSRKAVRTVQSVLNSTKGKIGRGRTFFFKAFGRDENEFIEMIQMPEAFIIKRWDAEISGLTAKWRNAYHALAEEDKKVTDKIVAGRSFGPECVKNQKKSIQKVLQFHLMDRADIPSCLDDMKEKRISDFEKTCPNQITLECRRLLKCITNESDT